MGCIVLQRTACIPLRRAASQGKGGVWVDVWQDGCEDDATDL